MALVVPVIPFAYRRTNYWQLQPHRLVFPMLLAAICCSVCGKSSRKKTARFWGGWLLCMLAVLWSTESGLFCIIGWCAGCIVRWWQQEHGTPAASGNAMVRCCWALCWRCWGPLA